MEKIKILDAVMEMKALDSRNVVCYLKNDKGLEAEHNLFKTSTGHIFPQSRLIKNGGQDEDEIRENYITYFLSYEVIRENISLEALEAFNENEPTGEVVSYLAKQFTYVDCYDILEEVAEEDRYGIYDTPEEAIDELLYSVDLLDLFWLSEQYESPVSIYKNREGDYELVLGY